MIQQQVQGCVPVEDTQDIHLKNILSMCGMWCGTLSVVLTIFF